MGWCAFKTVKQPIMADIASELCKNERETPFQKLKKCLFGITM